MKGSIRNICRALIVDKGHLLLARDKIHGHAFLPGGGVELGESLQEGLKREIYEEMGIDAIIERAYCVFENAWRQKELFCHELNFVFHVELSNTSFNKLIPSLEDHIEFFWVPIIDFANQYFLPKELKPIIIRFLEKGTLFSFYYSNMIDHLDS